jgi:hypothetical protein
MYILVGKRKRLYFPAKTSIIALDVKFKEAKNEILGIER